MEQIIKGKRYSVETATPIADDRYWDGSNYERQGRNTFLYRTPNGRFFLHHETRWIGERDHLVAITGEEAKSYYEELSEHNVDYEEAFGEPVEEA